MTLFNDDLMTHIWSVEQKHIKCIKDSDDVQLYMETGTRTRGGIELNTYQCAQGSVSLESFHLHFTWFIPGIRKHCCCFFVHISQ